MSHEPLTAQNGKYVSTRWALGVAVALLFAAVGGWGKWVHTTMTTDHDKLIQATAKITDLDRHILEVKATGLRTQELVRQVLREHRAMGLGGES